LNHPCLPTRFGWRKCPPNGKYQWVLVLVGLVDASRVADMFRESKTVFRPERRAFLLTCACLLFATGQQFSKATLRPSLPMTPTNRYESCKHERRHGNELAD
jgi:hypothetical protein